MLYCRYLVYGCDTVHALKAFDTVEEAEEFAKKDLRKWAKTVRDCETHTSICKYYKNAFGELVRFDFITSERKVIQQ